LDQLLKLLHIIILLFFSAALNAGTGLPLLDSANAAYQRNQFTKATKLYEQAIAGGASSPDIYYNLGNAYYRQNRIGLAILNYERARKLSPNDNDIGHNLQLAQEKVKDPPGEPGPSIGNAWQDFLSLLSEKEWSFLTAGMLLLAFLSFTAYTFNKQPARKRFYFFSGIFLLALTAFAYVCAKQQSGYSFSRREGILLAPSVTVHSKPDGKSDPVATLHEGAKVQLGESENGWVNVLFGRGEQGWIEQARLAEI